MKQKLLKTLAVGMMALVCTTAWAESTTIYPSTAMGCRIVADGSSYKYNNDASKLATITAETYESGYRNSGFFILEEWDFSTVNIERIKSIKITYSTKQNTGGRIWIYGSSLPEATTTAADLAATMNTVMGAYPGVDDATAIEGKSLANGGDRTNVATDVYQWSVSLSGTTLKTFMDNISSNKIVLVATTSAKSKLEYYTFKSETYKPKMVIEYYPVTVTIGETVTGYDELNSTLNTNLTDDATIKIFEDVKMSNRIQVAANKTVNVVPQKAGITITNTASNSLSFLANVASGRLNVGSDTYNMTVKYSSTSSTNSVVESSNSSSIIDIRNVTFSGISTSNEHGLIKANNGKVYLKNVTFTNCTSTYATNPSIIKCSNNDGVVFEGNNQFVSCTGYDIFAASRFKVNETNGVNHTTPIKVYTTLALGSVVATTVSANEVALFELLDDNKGFVKRTGQARYDMYATEAYTLNVSDAGAATLVLPFASTIPTGVSAYTLNYTTGNTSVKATEVTTTLTANTPVLINATEGKYKFTNTTNVSTTTTGSGTHKVGALTGVYTETTVPSGSYILTSGGTGVGFRKADGSTNTVAAYRAYLTADGAGSRLNIVYDDDATGIDNVERETQDADHCYNLQGVRMNGQLPKGIYVKNGKKFIVK